MNYTVAIVTTKLITFPSEAAAKKWVCKQPKTVKKGESIEYQVWNHSDAAAV